MNQALEDPDDEQAANPGTIMRRLWIRVNVPNDEPAQETERWVLTAISEYRHRQETAQLVDPVLIVEPIDGHRQA